MALLETYQAHLELFLRTYIEHCYRYTLTPKQRCPENLVMGLCTLQPHHHNNKPFPTKRCHDGGVSGGLLMHFGRNAITLRPKRTTASAERRTQERFSAPSGKHFQKDSTNKEKRIAGNIYAGVQNPLQGLACWEKSLYLRN